MNKLIPTLAIATALVFAPLATAPAHAHTAVITGVATCQTDGTYSVNWSVTLSNYGDHQEIDLKVITHTPTGSKINGFDGQVWLHEWAEHSANHGLTPFPANGVATYTQTGIPGTAKSASTTVQFDWKNGPSGDPVGKIDLPGNCTPPSPTLVEIPYPTLLGNEVCGVQNDTFYTDKAWLEQYGQLVDGPWIDPNYKMQNGLWVVDGSAQIKPEFRKTHIWAGAGSTTVSDFRRWQMYPGTLPFVYEDKGASDQATDAASPCFTPPTDTPDPPTATEPPLPVTLASAGPMDAFLTLVIGVFLLFAGLVVLGLIVYSRFYGRIHGPKRKSLNGSAMTEEENR